MKQQSIVPMLRATCETCGASFRTSGGQPDYTEHVARARLWAQEHARTERHRVFVEKITGTLYIGKEGSR